MGKQAYVRGERKNEEKRTLCSLRGSRQKKFSSVKFAGRFSAATNLFEGAELGARNAIFASESARLAPIIRGRATDAVATRDASGPSPAMTTCLPRTCGVARPPSAWKRARDDTSRARRNIPGGVGNPRRAAFRFFTTPRASPRLGTCVASGSWHAKPPRLKGRGAKPSFASMLMSLLTASADAGDDGGFSSDLSSGDASSPGTSGVPSDSSAKESIEKRRLPDARVATHPKLRTVSGHPVCAFALGGNRETRQASDVVAEAYARGVNYFFAYSMDDATIGDYLDGLRKLCSDKKTRKKIFVAVGMEDFTDKEKVTDHVAKCLARLGTDYVDAFYMEYVCRGDEEAAVAALEWMRNEGGLVVADKPGARAGIDGPVRFVGCSTHDRCVGVKLLRSERRDLSQNAEVFKPEGRTTEKEDAKDDDAVSAVKKTDAALDAFAETKSAAATVSTAEDLKLEFESSKPCALDFLMARYNMAHCKAEWRLFPVAQARDVPVIAFTSTRWNSLQKGHPRWHSSDPPSTAACMNWSLSHPAVQVVLNSAPDVGYLSEWADELSETGVRTMDEKDLEKWKEYGELVYDESAAFETLF